VKPATSNPAPGFTTYLVVDGNQGQVSQIYSTIQLKQDKEISF
jgi:hypothetical protein